MPPLFQDIPGYCCTLTLLVLCFDRHQSIRHPEMAPLPIVWILGLVWAISIALVLPYMAYITHVDLSVSDIKRFSVMNQIWRASQDVTKKYLNSFKDGATVAMFGSNQMRAPFCRLEQHVALHSSEINGSSSSSGKWWDRAFFKPAKKATTYVKVSVCICR